MFAVSLLGVRDVTCSGLCLFQTVNMNMMNL